jgi:hypothetical protein
MVLGIKPLRWALQFSPPTIVLEYQSAMGNQMYHYRIDMGERISSSMVCMRYQADSMHFVFQNMDLCFQRRENMSLFVSSKKNIRTT